MNKKRFSNRNRAKSDLKTDHNSCSRRISGYSVPQNSTLGKRNTNRISTVIANDDNNSRNVTLLRSSSMLPMAFTQSVSDCPREAKTRTSGGDVAALCPEQDPAAAAGTISGQHPTEAAGALDAASTSAAVAAALFTNDFMTDAGVSLDQKEEQSQSQGQMQQQQQQVRQQPVPRKESIASNRHTDAASPESDGAGQSSSNSSTYGNEASKNLVQTQKSCSAAAAAGNQSTAAFSGDDHDAGSTFMASAAAADGDSTAWSVEDLATEIAAAVSSASTAAANTAFYAPGFSEIAAVFPATRRSEASTAPPAAVEAAEPPPVAADKTRASAATSPLSNAAAVKLLQQQCCSYSPASVPAADRDMPIAAMEEASMESVILVEEGSSAVTVGDVRERAGRIRSHSCNSSSSTRHQTQVQAASSTRNSSGSGADQEKQIKDVPVETLACGVEVAEGRCTEPVGGSQIYQLPLMALHGQRQHNLTQSDPHDSSGTMSRAASALRAAPEIPSLQQGGATIQSPKAAAATCIEKQALLGGAVNNNAMTVPGGIDSGNTALVATIDTGILGFEAGAVEAAAIRLMSLLPGAARDACGMASEIATLAATATTRETGAAATAAAGTLCESEAAGGGHYREEEIATGAANATAEQHEVKGDARAKSEHAAEEEKRTERACAVDERVLADYTETATGLSRSPAGAKGVLQESDTTSTVSAVKEQQQSLEATATAVELGLLSCPIPLLLRKEDTGSTTHQRGGDPKNLQYHMKAVTREKEAGSETIMRVSTSSETLELEKNSHTGSSSNSTGSNNRGKGSGGTGNKGNKSGSNASSKPTSSRGSTRSGSNNNRSRSNSSSRNTSNGVRTSFSSNNSKSDSSDTNNNNSRKTSAGGSRGSSSDAVAAAASLLIRHLQQRAQQQQHRFPLPPVTQEEEQQERHMQQQQKEETQWQKHSDAQRQQQMQEKEFDGPSNKQQHDEQPGKKRSRDESGGGGRYKVGKGGDSSSTSTVGSRHTNRSPTCDALGAAAAALLLLHKKQQQQPGEQEGRDQKTGKTDNSTQRLLLQLRELFVTVQQQQQQPCISKQRQQQHYGNSSNNGTDLAQKLIGMLATAASSVLSLRAAGHQRKARSRQNSHSSNKGTCSSSSSSTGDTVTDSSNNTNEKSISSNSCSGGVGYNPGNRKRSREAGLEELPSQLTRHESSTEQKEHILVHEAPAGSLLRHQQQEQVLLPAVPTWVVDSPTERKKANGVTTTTCSSNSSKTADESVLIYALDAGAAMPLPDAVASSSSCLSTQQRPGQQQQVQQQQVKQQTLRRSLSTERRGQECPRELQGLAVAHGDERDSVGAATLGKETGAEMAAAEITSCEDEVEERLQSAQEDREKQNEKKICGNNGGSKEKVLGSRCYPCCSMRCCSCGSTQAAPSALLAAQPSTKESSQQRETDAANADAKGAWSGEAAIAEECCCGSNAHSEMAAVTDSSNDGCVWRQEATGSRKESKSTQNDMHVCMCSEEVSRVKSSTCCTCSSGEYGEEMRLCGCCCSCSSSSKEHHVRPYSAASARSSCCCCSVEDDGEVEVCCCGCSDGFSRGVAAAAAVVEPLNNDPKHHPQQQQKQSEALTPGTGQEGEPTTECELGATTEEATKAAATGKEKRTGCHHTSQNDPEMVTSFWTDDEEQRLSEDEWTDSDEEAEEYLQRVLLASCYASSSGSTSTSANNSNNNSNSNSSNSSNSSLSINSSLSGNSSVSSNSSNSNSNSSGFGGEDAERQRRHFEVLRSDVCKKLRTLF